MLNKIDDMCAERERLKRNSWSHEGQSAWRSPSVAPLKYYDEKSDPPWIKALAEVRRRACHEGWCYHHVQAIILSID
jgi:hypothetical protein